MMSCSFCAIYSVHEAMRKTRRRRVGGRIRSSARGRWTWVIAFVVVVVVAAASLFKLLLSSCCRAWLLRFLLR